MKKENNKSHTFTPLILLAMLASGGLGIMQKIQQKNTFSEQKNEFLTIAFIFAFLTSFLAFWVSKNKKPPSGKHIKRRFPQSKVRNSANPYAEIIVNYPLSIQSYNADQKAERKENYEQE